MEQESPTKANGYPSHMQNQSSKKWKNYWELPSGIIFRKSRIVYHTNKKMNIQGRDQMETAKCKTPDSNGCLVL
jgi:hypothetical protein